jgi:hypothetical protein
VTAPAPYVDENGVYHSDKIAAIKADGTPLILVYWQDDDGRWHEGWYTNSGELHSDMRFAEGRTPDPMPGAPWGDLDKDLEAKKKQEIEDLNAAYKKLIDQGYSHGNAQEELYRLGLVTREFMNYSVTYSGAKYGGKSSVWCNGAQGYDPKGFPYDDKNGNRINGYLDDNGYFVEGFFYEGGMPWYDENGNYKGFYEAKRIQHGEVGMHWERDSSGKMVGTYNGVVIPVPYIEPITPEEFRALFLP